MPTGRGHEKGRTCPRTYVYGVSRKKEERRNDLVGPKPGGGGGGRQEEASSGAWILSLSRPSVLEHGKEKEKGNWALGSDEIRVYFGKRF